MLHIIHGDLVSRSNHPINISKGDKTLKKEELTHEKIKEVSERIIEQIKAAVGTDHVAIGMVVSQLRSYVKLEQRLEHFNKFAYTPQDLKEEQEGQ